MNILIIIILFLGISLFLIALALMTKISYPICFDGFKLFADCLIKEINNAFIFFATMVFILFLWSLCVAAGIVFFCMYPLIQTLVYMYWPLVFLPIIAPFGITFNVLKRKKDRN